MKHFHKLQFIVAAVLVILFLSTINANAESIKDRMRARLPLISSLKTDGLIGENNMGYLKFIKDSQKNADAIADENMDRQQVYSEIAVRQGASVDTVGKRRAQQIADKAKPGQWLQTVDGKWYQK